MEEIRCCINIVCLIELVEVILSVDELPIRIIRTAVLNNLFEFKEEIEYTGI